MKSTEKMLFTFYPGRRARRSVPPSALDEVSAGEKDPKILAPVKLPPPGAAGIATGPRRRYPQGVRDSARTANRGTTRETACPFRVHRCPGEKPL